MSAAVPPPQTLAGEWEFRFDGEAAWRPIRVPGCWEELGGPKDEPGPAWYRTRVPIPTEFADRRVWLRFGAVSYHCTVSLNGRAVGEHTGAWDAFTVEITDAVVPGTTAELLVRVEKPASLQGGPAAPAGAGAFPLKETLAGFLPYVWGHAFGGIWQDVTLFATGRAAFGNVHVAGTADGRVAITAELMAPGKVTLTLHDPNGRQIAERTGRGEAEVRFEVLVPAPRPWSPADPARYEIRLRLADGDERTIRFGLRSLAVGGTTLLLNDRPLYPRLALSWGWYADRLHPNPGPERVRADLERLRRLGYNGVKLCLWFPPPYYFDLADELGMLLWVELPMWLPEPTPFFRRQTLREYARLVRQARNHPSVVLYSLGCELGGQVGADLLGPLYALVKDLVGDALVRDNSGSGEAFGGLLKEYADYDDHHFYADLPFFRGLLDHFSPRWRPERPWVFGEFCDHDTYRDLRRVAAWHRRRQAHPASGSEPLAADVPWWTSADPRRNPQGARWQYDVPEHDVRLRANGYWERGAELERLSERQSLLHRKWTLELTRTYREVSGYVVTGEVDTPISTAGMWDDTGRLKFDPDEFRTFNGDLVLLVGWDRRRAWLAGGDRVARWDTVGYAAGATVRPHLIVSHYGAATAPARIAWSVAFPGEAPFAAGEATTSHPLSPGTVREGTVAEFLAPTVAAPRRATLRARLELGGQTARNAWPLWFFPAAPWDWPEGLALVDEGGRLRDLPHLAPAIRKDLERATVAVATSWTPAVAAFVAGGGAAVLAQAGEGPPGPVATVALPFWREAVRIVAPHPAWGDFPHDGLAGWQFLGCATDHALETAPLPVTPILRRLDARTMRVHDYAAELAWGAGRLIVTTLRFEGGQGEQPFGVQRNTAAAYLLRCFVGYLAARARDRQSR